MLECSERYLVDYAACSTIELQRFVADRGIREGHNITQNTERATLEQLLLAEDESPRCGRFFDLPQEVRDQIYEYYFAGFRDDHVSIWPTRGPSELRRARRSPALIPAGTIADFPPLVYVSRQLRAETLPMFWSKYEVHAGLSASHGISMGFVTSYSQHSARWKPATRNTFRLAASHGMLGWLRGLHVDFEYAWSYVDLPMTVTRSKLIVDFKQGTLRLRGDSLLESPITDIAGGLSDLLTPILERIAANPSGGAKVSVWFGDRVVALIAARGHLVSSHATRQLHSD
ncbi:hypothetical protein B0A48_11174 [Cryoendolithus antarcticus]|uniref:F-box domain-containing protein n=1 Tax=Cryoendolithus antarcticus TaxID=1507870 RepID=A0A1V8SV27_9PEZI|nr:hypothetical protein B0A48_11174 [Cryoendolithus antarcticus]